MCNKQKIQTSFKLNNLNSMLSNYMMSQIIDIYPGTLQIVHSLQECLEYLVLYKFFPLLSLFVQFFLITRITKKWFCGIERPQYPKRKPGQGYLVNFVIFLKSPY